MLREAGERPLILPPGGSETMTGRRSAISGVRGLLYTLARLLGDVSAIHRGPKAVVKRLERRAVGRATGKLLGELFK